MPLKPTSFTESPTPPPMAGRPRRKASELAARKIQLDLGLDRRCPDSYRIDAIASDRVTWGEEFGRGTSAVIHRGSWRKGRRANPKAVALKWLKHAGREYDAEAKLLKQCEHRNVLEVFGVFEKSGRIVIVTELCERHSLLEIFRAPDAEAILRERASSFMREVRVSSPRQCKFATLCSNCPFTRPRHRWRRGWSTCTTCRSSTAT